MMAMAFLAGFMVGAVVVLAAAALVCGFVWLGVEGRLPEWLVPCTSEIAAVVTLYAGLTMVSNAPFFSGKSYAVVRTVPFWVIVVGALLWKPLKKYIRGEDLKAA